MNVGRVVVTPLNPSRATGGYVGLLPLSRGISVIA
jgi:hypothetical protein